MSLEAEKAALRERMRRVRGAIDEEERQWRSAKLTSRLIDSAKWQRARGVALFAGVAGEPDTSGLLRAALDAGKTVWLPRIVSRAPPTLQLEMLRDVRDLAPGTWGIPEPPAATEATPVTTLAARLDMIVVPGLAFAPDGRRLGHGKGYYDRLLAPMAAAPTPLRLGLCFVDQIENDVPADPARDVVMHAILHERAWVDCPRRSS